jgi:hypothetical protein
MKLNSKASEERLNQLDRYFEAVQSVILARQHPVTGLDLRLQVGDLLLRGGNSVGAGDKSTRRVHRAASRDHVEVTRMRKIAMSVAASIRRLRCCHDSSNDRARRLSRSSLPHVRASHTAAFVSAAAAHPATLIWLQICQEASPQNLQG